MRPRTNVGLVPVRKLVGGRRVPGEPPETVGPVRNDHHGCGPTAVEVEGVTVKEANGASRVHLPAGIGVERVEKRRAVGGLGSALDS